MYDIKINNDGTLDLSTGDARPVAYSAFVAQKIYMAIMSMPMNEVTGTDETKPDSVVLNITGYLANYFRYDLDVTPSGFSIDLLSRGSQRMSFSLTYEGVSPEGELVTTASGYSYNISAGTIQSIDYQPPWLETRESPEEEYITLGITVDSPTNEIEIPVEPARNKYSLGRSYDYITEDTESGLLEDGATVSDSASTEPCTRPAHQ